MHPPGSAELLAAWERSRSCPSFARPAAILECFNGDGGPGDWAGCPLGRRDEKLLAVREQVFGPELICLGECPRCQTSVEFMVRTEDLPRPPAEHEDVRTLECDGVALTFRLPNTHDLIAIRHEPETGRARRQLFKRCLRSAMRPDGTPLAADGISDELVQAAGERMAEADPAANLSFALVCPACGGGWEATFDAASFFDQELTGWARRLLGEVHELALAYGWSEADILALSPQRRQVYLERVRA